MELIRLTPQDLTVAASLVLLTAALSWRLRLGVEGRLVWAAARSIVQLLLLGVVLKTLFAQANPLLIGLLALFMLAVAGYEVMARQQRRFGGAWGIGIGTLSMFVSSFSLTLLATRLVIGIEPWYTPQYLIPLLGMLLGNTMSGVALALNNLTENAVRQRGEIEARLILGHGWECAIEEIRRTALRTGLIPIINAMAAAGVVSLPGMMTGQILAGSPPLDAAMYQIMIMLLIAVGTSLGAIVAVWIASRRLFDERQRLRLDRLD
ncbi:MAG: iron export ABC transporter permease subunit FetB [Candidatus Sedimenticola endophacoides]|uniref:Iron export ABC transporter permease subunit FetB n=1 Tax=Candidatus Sedimenticola endophacoides TaxID=2548426 RepID=A0A6N4E2A6_9GAMM|nr:MAG: iron export ABC transporter permease subunit FetB [Candidatus Sedimenticola endophacoides]OQX38385.1 MAG: iron export ABC transporter permease subunit FetB [Candidatus Sedimenticola endophacoides]OQX38816.1 MAG: iron export ABC transporter permease subunit FetB [Candidatus Sedimenticola endophacoides]OQX41566.1 MAG: iron export ABC transporter permease subunit FetB [Candidatus Sedimenticola endophacoides]PUD98721.1 MAG: iron export ABC transporter permease subunit FetB [Candidatus Sedim